uniref:Uncharacterized protein n=1 Tax=Arion vulgaris TaxID=1028688 RepID=A0A0B7ASD2_9EUPU
MGVLCGNVLGIGVQCAGHTGGLCGSVRGNRLASTAQIFVEWKMDSSFGNHLLDDDTQIDIKYIQQFKEFGLHDVHAKLDA